LTKKGNEFRENDGVAVRGIESGATVWKSGVMILTKPKVIGNAQSRKICPATIIPSEMPMSAIWAGIDGPLRLRPHLMQASKGPRHVHHGESSQTH
jgi:hypothetical protein